MRQSRPIQVGMVLEKGFPPDSRVEREAQALVDAGYRVSLLCLKQSPTLPDVEWVNQVEVIRVDPKQAVWSATLPMLGWKVKSRFFCRGFFRSWYKEQTGIESDWEQYITWFIRSRQLDVLHVHDLKLLKTCLHVVKKLKRPLKIVADLHEHYPALMAYTVEQTKGREKAQKKFAWWTKHERKCLPLVDHIIVVTEEAKERLQTIPGVAAQNITVVRNVVDYHGYMNSLVNAKKPDLDPFLGKFVVCYVGYINNTHRGLQTVLEAIPHLVRVIPNLMFVGVGRYSQPYFDDVLKPIIERHNLQDVVHFTGYRRETEFLPYIEQAHIGLVPHVKTLLTDFTFPNKLFLYQMLGKPVVVSSCEPLKRYIQETQSGLVFESENPDDLAHQIETLYHHPELQTLLGNNGYQAVTNRYCWDVEKQHLLKIYPSLLAPSPQADFVLTNQHPVPA